MLHRISQNALALRCAIQLPCGIAALITIAACGSGSGSGSETGYETGYETGSGLAAAIPDNILNEILAVNLEPNVSYEWRVRAISAHSAGPWSSEFLLETDAGSDEILDVRYIPDSETFADDSNEEIVDADEIVTNEFCDPLFNDSCNPLFNDNVSPTLNDLVQQPSFQDEPDFTGVPMFSWEHDDNALAYEIEVSRTDTLQRIGIFQYAESAVCIEGNCELVLQNTRAESLDIPPILLITHTVVESEAPYVAELPSPVVDFANLPNYSHTWSIEGRFEEFPDEPNFSHTFDDAGSYIVNVLVTSAEGRSEYAYATVNLNQLAKTASTGTNVDTDIGNTPVNSVDNSPSLLAALLEQPEESSTTADINSPAQLVPAAEENASEGAEQTVDSDSSGDENPAADLSAPVVSVSEQNSPADILPESNPVEGLENPSSQQPIVEQVEEESPVTTVPETTVLAASESETTEPETMEPEVAAAETEQPVAETPVVSNNSQDVVNTDGWDNNLPNGGRALGIVTSGITTGNAALNKHKSSRRFLATRSGSVQSFSYLNRVLRSGDIEDRADRLRTSQPIWYEVQQAVGNDPKRGGYMLSNSYSVGNGGLQEVTLQTDDGSPEQLPSGTVIARAAPFVPFDLPLGKWVTIDFETQGAIQAGQVYHLVYENLNPPPGSIRGLSGAEAQSAPADKGAIALDGTTDGVALDPLERHGPFLRDFPATLIKRAHRQLGKPLTSQAGTASPIPMVWRLAKPMRIFRALVLIAMTSKGANRFDKDLLGITQTSLLIE